VSPFAFDSSCVSLVRWLSFRVLISTSSTRQCVSAPRSLVSFRVLTCPSPCVRQQVSVSCSLVPCHILTCPSYCARQFVGVPARPFPSMSYLSFTPCSQAVSDSCFLMSFFVFTCPTLCSTGSQRTLLVHFFLCPDLFLPLSSTVGDGPSCELSSSPTFLLCPELSLPLPSIDCECLRLLALFMCPKLLFSLLPTVGRRPLLICFYPYPDFFALRSIGSVCLLLSLSVS